MKLTKTMREITCNAAAGAMFNERIKEALAILTQQVMSAKLAAGDRLASEIPAGWEQYIDTHSSVEVAVHLDDFGIETNSMRTDKYLRINLPQPFAGNYNRHDFGDYRTLWDNPAVHAIRAIYKEREQFIDDCMAILNSCTTDKHLQDTAPELAKYLPAPKEPGGALVSVETVSRVRAMLAK